MPDRVVGGQRVGFDPCFHLGPERSVKQIIYFLWWWGGAGGGWWGTGLALVEQHFNIIHFY